MIQNVDAIRITFSLPSLLLRHENIGMGVIAGGNSSCGIGSCRSRGRSICWDALRVDGKLRDRCWKGSNVFEDMSRVEEFGIDVFGSEEILADDEDLRGNVTRG
jgi:hypothetical protein